MQNINSLNNCNNFVDLKSFINGIACYLPKEFNENFEIAFNKVKDSPANNIPSISISQILDKLKNITERAVRNASNGNDISQGVNTLNLLINISSMAQYALNGIHQTLGPNLRDYKYSYFSRITDQFNDIKALFLRARMQQLTEALLYPNFDGLSRTLMRTSNLEMQEDLIGVYLTTNESNSRSIREVLMLGSGKGRGCHLGFSGFHNFDVMVARQSRRGIVVDFNPWNAVILEHALSLMLTCKSREEWLKEFTITVQSLDAFSSTKRTYFSPNVNDEPDFAMQKECYGPKEELENELHREGSWLSSEESYQYIKQLAEAGKIVCVTGDIRQTPIFEKLALSLKKHGEPIDTLYLSNICKYMETDEDKAAFKNTVKALAQNETFVINCPWTDTGKDPIQHVCFGEQYLQNPKAPFFYDLGQ